MNNFFEYYKSLQSRPEKRLFRKSIMEKCKVEQATFYAWLAKKRVPPWHKANVSEILKIHQEIGSTKEIEKRNS